MISIKTFYCNFFSGGFKILFQVSINFRINPTIFFSKNS